MPCEGREPRTPDRTFPIELQVGDPVCSLHERRTGAAPRVGDAYSVAAGAEADPLRWMSHRHQSFDERCGKLRSNTASAMRFFRISIEPPAIIQPRQRRTQYSTSSSCV